jgi:predicted esterase
MGAGEARAETYVHRFVPGTEPDSPTILLLHGTGGDENDLMPLGRLLAPGAALLSLRGNVLENGMPRFFRRFAEGVFDLEDLARRTIELADFLAAARERYALGDRPLVAAGFSNGANIASSLMLTRPGVLDAGVLFRAMVTVVPDPLPRLADKPVFLSAGRTDTMVGIDQPERLADLLRSCGARVTLSWDEGGHMLAVDSVRKAREWLGAIGLVTR